MKYPNDKMLVYLAVGDAYCLATEYVDPAKKDFLKQALEFNKYLSHPSRTEKIQPGCFTDDTQMSIGVVCSILDEDYSELSFANSWLNTFKQDPREGYARGFYKFLTEVQSGEEFLQKIKPHSDKNGAAMRSVPLGVLPTPNDVMDVARRQASITHDTPGGIFSSLAVALMSHYALYEDGPLDRLSLGGYLRHHLQPLIQSNELFSHVFAKPWEGRVAGSNIGLITAKASFEIIISSQTLLDVLTKTIELGGDTDSVAAIAMGIASTRLEDNLPEFMFQDLEPNSNYGQEFLLDLGKKLMHKFK